MSVFEDWWNDKALQGLGPAARLTAEEAMDYGYRTALERIRRFGDHLKGYKALTDEERYILAQAADLLEQQGVDG